MKKLILIVCGTVLFSFPFISSVKSQDLYEKANIRKYEKANQELPATTKKEKRVVFMGNSITEGWVGTHPEFFTENNYIGRGISGQTSPQMLMRFYGDVVALKPKAVVINAGTNDVAENTGAYHPDFTLNNIKAMASITNKMAARHQRCPSKNYSLKQRNRSLCQSKQIRICRLFLRYER